jgi:hypothetical protein
MIMSFDRVGIVLRLPDEVGADLAVSEVEQTLPEGDLNPSTSRVSGSPIHFYQSLFSHFINKIGHLISS